jgi:nucleotide-binding universal stress UspA family protein
MGVYEHIVGGVDGPDTSAPAGRRPGCQGDRGVRAAAADHRAAVRHGNYLDSYWQEAERLAAETLEGARRPWRFGVRTGDPAIQLDLAAEEHGAADLVVVGARGHSITHRLLLGSVSTRLLHHARRPVLSGLPEVLHVTVGQPR